LQRLEQEEVLRQARLLLVQPQLAPELALEPEQVREPKLMPEPKLQQAQLVHHLLPHVVSQPPTAL
jgi:hypothetical protein